MGRLVTNPVKPVVRVNVAQSNYKGIANLAQTVHDDMLTNVGTFPTPIPTSANFQTAIDNLKTSIASLGNKFNRGGSAALADTKALSFIVFSMLTMRAMYVQLIVDASNAPTIQAVVISLSGFATKSKKSRVPVNQFVKRARQSNSKNFPQTLRRVTWDKPLGNFSGFRPKAYNVYGFDVQNNRSTFITTVTACVFLAPATFMSGGGPIPLATVIIRPLTASGEGNAFKIDVK